VTWDLLTRLHKSDYRNQDFGHEGIYADIQDLATRIELAQAELLLTDNDYFQMMRAKTVITQKFVEAFKKVDAIVFPSTAVPAPESHPLDVKYGRDDPANEQRYNPFTPIANLIGTPSVGCLYSLCFLERVSLSFDPRSRFPLVILTPRTPGPRCRSERNSTAPGGAKISSSVSQTHARIFWSRGS
jgi:hypothetical protein